MINIFVNKDFEKMRGKFSEKDKKTIHESLNKIIHGKKPILRRIPSSDLYAKKIKGIVLIFSKKEKGLYLMDIMKREEFEKEFRKSIFLF